MADLDDLILRFSGWLGKRCAHEAWKLPEVTAGELFQATILRFLVRARDGWFDQDPIESVEAQAMTLLALCLRHEVTAIVRYRRRWVPTDGTVPEPGSEGGGHSAIPPDPVPRDELQRLLELLDRVTTPTRRLSLLSRDIPLAVLLHHVEAAKAFRTGGANMVVRPAEEAHAMLDERRSQPGASLSAWKVVLGAIYYGTGPLERVPGAVAAKGAGTVERQANRALQDLREWLVHDGGDR